MVSATLTGRGTGLHEKRGYKRPTQRKGLAGPELADFCVFWVIALFRKRYVLAYRSIGEWRLRSQEVYISNSPNYNDLTATNDGLAYLAYFLACFSLLFPLRPQPCFKPSAVFKTWKQTERPAVAAIAAVSHFNRLQNEWLIEPRRKQDEAQNRIEAF